MPRKIVYRFPAFRSSPVSMPLKTGGSNVSSAGMVSLAAELVDFQLDTACSIIIARRETKFRDHKRGEAEKRRAKRTLNYILLAACIHAHVTLERGRGINTCTHTGLYLYFCTWMWDMSAIIDAAVQQQQLEILGKRISSIPPFRNFTRHLSSILRERNLFLSKFFLTLNDEYEGPRLQYTYVSLCTEYDIRFIQNMITEYEHMLEKSFSNVPPGFNEYYYKIFNR